MEKVQILVVDDHEAVRRGLRTLLSTRQEWQVCGEATDGREAVERVKEHQPDVVLMDISMPRMNGIDATRIIRRDSPDVRVIIVSQDDPAVVRLRAREVDAAGYVPKSKLAEELLPTIDRVVKTIATKENGQPKLAEPPAASPSNPDPTWVAGGGVTGQLIRDHDWSKTSLGAMDQWPQSLRTSLSICLASRFPILIWWGPEYVMLYNDSYMHLLGAKHPKAVGQVGKECWGEIWHIVGPMLDSVFFEGKSTWSDDQLLIAYRNGYFEECYFTFSYSPITGEDGAIRGIFCAVTETTARVLSERRLRTLRELSPQATTPEQAARYAASALEKNPRDIPFALIYLGEPDGKRARLAGTAGIAPGTSASPEFIDLENESSAVWPIATAWNSGQPQLIEEINKRFDRLPTGPWPDPPHSVVVVPIPQKGEAQLFCALVLAISPRRMFDEDYRAFFMLIAGHLATGITQALAYEAERNRAEALAKIDRAKTAFFSNVSHEFRTPLTLMLGPIEEMLTESRVSLPPQAKQQLELVNRNGARLLRLVNTLLDFSRIEAGRAQAVYRPTDLAQLTTELASAFQSATERAGLQLVLDISPLSEPVFVDRDMWEKIVLNLISNAFKFTFEGRITVSLRQVDQHAELRVSDTGVGIPDSELPRLFERFHRIENSRSRTHEGTGIGLALVQELVKQHGGTVHVESAEGRGSTFMVTIPLGSAHLPAGRIGATPTQLSTAVNAAPFVGEALRWLPDSETADAAQFFGDERHTDRLLPLSGQVDGQPSRPRILVVDDNADMRHYLSHLLHDRFEVRTAEDGQAALESVQTQLPDLVLADVMMPRLDGLGLLRQLRQNENTQTIPVIFLSARAGEEYQVERIAHGADDYLVKPFSARELLARVQTHVELARVRQEVRRELQQKEHRLRLATDVAELGIWHWYPAEDRVTWENDRMYKILRRSSDDGPINAAEFSNHIVHPDDREEFGRALGRAVATNTRFFYQGRIVHKDGSQSWIEFNGAFEGDGVATPMRLLGTARDVTQRKLDELREQQIISESTANMAKFRAVFEQTSVFAAVMTLDGTLIDANRLCLDICGYRADEVLGKKFWDTGWWRKSQEIKEKIRAATFQAAAGRPFREIMPYWWADGSEHIVDFALHPIQDQDGKIIFLHPTGVDITDLKRAEENYRALAETLEEQVRDRTDELEQRNDEILAQSEQLRGLSHRLLQMQDEERRRIARELHDSAGQTIAALGMNLAMLNPLAKTSPAVARVMQDGENLVRELSQEIRITSYLLHPPLLDESGVAEALRWYVEGLRERSGMNIALDISPDFGRLSQELELVIFRIVQECLTNVHRHSGSRAASIRVLRDPQEVTLEIQDEGKGIAPEKLREVQSRGVGVGIRGMRERVLQVGGKFEIHSDGRGTKIIVTVPL